MADHSARAHATWAASSTAANWHCPGRIALTKDMPSTSSIHAARGTAAHTIAEQMLREGGEAIEALGETIKVDGFDITFDEEIVASAQTYADYVRQRVKDWFGPPDAVPPNFMYHAALNNVLALETRLPLTALDPPFDAGGTVDARLVFPAERLIEIVDFKHGVGVVEADSPQLKTYALGTLLDLSPAEASGIDTIRTTIVQPRAHHASGRIRSETFHVAFLVDWAADLLAAMGRSKQALDEFEAAGSNTVLLDTWAEKWLKPGKCKFCPAEGTCPALRREALKVAQVYFQPETGAPKIANSALDDSPEALSRDLKMLGMLEDWISARRQAAHRLAENGTAIPGYKLVQKQGNRKWSDDAAAEAALRGAGIEPLVAKLISVAQAEKALTAARVKPATRKEIVDPLATRPITGTALIAEEQPTHMPLATPPAAQYFDPNAGA